MYNNPLNKTLMGLIEGKDRSCFKTTDAKLRVRVCLDFFAALIMGAV